MSVVIDLVDVKKSFTMHLQGGMRLPVVSGVTFSARTGECVALAGPSGRFTDTTGQSPHSRSRA